MGRRKKRVTRAVVHKCNPDLGEHPRAWKEAEKGAPGTPFKIDSAACVVIAFDERVTTVEIWMKNGYARFFRKSAAWKKRRQPMLAGHRSNPRARAPVRLCHPFFSSLVNTYSHLVAPSSSLFSLMTRCIDEKVKWISGEIFDFSVRHLQ